MPTEDDHEPDGRPTTPVPWDRAEFDELTRGIVTDFAPRRFAIVQELGDMLDGRVAAWGLAWPDRMMVTGDDDRSVMFLQRPDHALARYRIPPDVSSHLVWVDPEPAADEADGDESP